MQNHGSDQFPGAFTSLLVDEPRLFDRQLGPLPTEQTLPEERKA